METSQQKLVQASGPFCKKRKKRKTNPNLHGLAQSQLSIKGFCLILTSSSSLSSLLFRASGQKSRFIYVGLEHRVVTTLRLDWLERGSLPPWWGCFAPPLNNLCFVAGFPWSSPGGKWWNSTQASSKWHAATMTTRLCECKAVKSLQLILWNSITERMRVSIQPTDNKEGGVVVCWWVQQFNLSLIAHNLNNYPRTGLEYEYDIIGCCTDWQFWWSWNINFWRIITQDAH